MPALGFDFGTTNSAMALAGEGGAPRLTRTFRSVLYFDPDERKGGRPVAVVGPDAIERSLASDGSGRLIQSLKSYLGSRQFRATNVFGQTYTLEELIAMIVRGLLEEADRELGAVPRRGVVGRPVRFAGEPEDQDYALARLAHALRAGGFEEVVFEYEPVAAAYHYETGLDHDELVLVADFGGGTSDFCLIRVGPGARRAGTREIPGTEGVALAGDAFDARVVRRLVAPELGKGTEYVSHGKLMPVPPWLYTHLERWHHLSFLKSRETLKLLGDIQDGATAPGKIAGLVHLVDADLGFQLSRAVQATKVGLSADTQARFTFVDDPIAIDRRVTRPDFEGWIADEVAAISAAVDRLLAATGVTPREVDKVFMTGGSSLVPVVRNLFATRFGPDRLMGGGELTSVASGLALRARDL